MTRIQNVGEKVARDVLGQYGFADLDIDEILNHVRHTSKAVIDRETSVLTVSLVGSDRFNIATDSKDF